MIASLLPPISVLTLETGDRLQLGPIALPWHGLLTAAGLIVATVFALRYARERKLDEDKLMGLVSVIVISGMIGARLFYLVEQEPGSLLRPGDWFGTTGFSFYGAILIAVPAGALYLRNDDTRLQLLDAAASGFGLGMAIGRIGDVLIGEHLGDPSSLPWAFRYTNPDALAPTMDLAYQPGALYESLLGLLIFAVVWPRRWLFRTPGVLIAVVIGLYATGRFALFFLRNDSDVLVAGLSNAQVTSLFLAVAAFTLTRLLRHKHAEADPKEAPSAKTPPTLRRR